MSLREAASYYADQYGIEPELFYGLVQQESGWSPQARNPSTGAFGLTQAMPATADDPGFGVAPLKNRQDPNEQLRFGAQYLDAMLDRYDGDERKALAAYNWGPGNADDWSGDMSALPDETRGYISNILGMAGGGGVTPPSGPASMGAGGDEPPPPAAPLPALDPIVEGWMPKRTVTTDDGREQVIYGDNIFGRGVEGIDKRRAGLQEKIGVRGTDALGSLLSQWGMQMLEG